MKIIVTAILVLVVTKISFAQDELYGAGVVGDTVKIWDVNISSVCNSKYIASVSLPKDSIIVIEQDTSTLQANCTCLYDLDVSLTGLHPDNYQIVIYRQQFTKLQFPKDSLLLVASFSFSTAGSNTQRQNVKISASDCHRTPFSVRQDQVASNFTLLTSYPNPFNPKATIHYAIPRTALVSLAVFDNVGRTVAILVNEKKEAGEYSVQFDGSKLRSGVYICRLIAGNSFLTNKLMLAK
ncbi:MAG: T9SS type A sorting domain-containing protein [Bacteroidota bacterium]